MYEIREYEKEEKEQLIDLWVKVVVEEFGYEQWREEVKADPLEYEKILVAKEENEVIGSMAYKKVDEKTAELKRVYIYKEYRGKGIAKELYSKILEIIKNEGYKKIIVETWDNLQSGINFYYKNDFKLDYKDGKRIVLSLNIN